MDNVITRLQDWWGLQRFSREWDRMLAQAEASGRIHRIIIQNSRTTPTGIELVVVPDQRESGTTL